MEAEPVTSEEKQAAQDAADYALMEQLETGQIYLSREEVFAQDMADEAFVTTEGADMRGPRGLRNLATASNLVNFHSSDGIVLTLWGFDRALPAKLAPVIGAKDAETLAALFDRLTRENPRQVTSIAEARARYLSSPRPAMLGAAPLNTYIGSQTQIALRMSFIVAVARDITAAGLELSELWFQAARQKEPLLSREEFKSRFNVDLTGVAGYRRGIGYSGNFFRGVGKSVSKLFRRPLDWFRSALKEGGRYVQLLNTPFTWLRKVPIFGAALGGIGSVFTDELANAMISGKLSTFNEQRVVKTIGQVAQQVGFVMQLVGGVLVVFGGPLAAIGGVLVAVGTLLVITGQAILRLQAMVRAQRVNHEEYLRELARLKKLKAQQQQEVTALDVSSAAPAAKASLVPLALGGLLIFFALR